MAAPWKMRGYVVERLLGTGATADVWRARVASTGDAVALKRIAVTDAAQEARARHEAGLLAVLDHPNLIRLHALLPADGALVLVLDLAEGGSLCDVLTARGRLAPGEVITAISPVAAAVSYLHSEAVVHGDVSAANILFTDAGAPLLCDVGVARLTGDDRDAEGTPAYMDPAVASGRVPGPQSDVFSLGAVAFHALTGTPLWAGATQEETLALAAGGVPTDLVQRLHAADVPDAVAAPVLHALAADPHRRGTAVELALDLRQSGIPVAVEFGAGRARVEPRLPDRSGSAGGRHAAPDRGHTGHEPVDGGSAEPRSAGRPVFDRPGSARAEPGTEPPTWMVGPRPRPSIPRTTGRRRGPIHVAPRHRRLIGAAVVLLAGAAAAVAAILLPGDGDSAVAAAHSSRVARAGSAVASAGATLRRSDETPTSASAPSGSAPSGPAPSAAEPPPHPPSVDPLPAHEPSVPSRSHRQASASPGRASEWEQVLSDLDAVRAEAYATRAPGMLARVYVRGALLEHDSAQLQRLVPIGCGLTGALTAYRVLHVSSGGGRSLVTVTAQLPATRLVCDGAARSQAPAIGSTRLRIEVADTAAGPRISAERRL